MTLYFMNGAILLFQAGKNCFVTLCGGSWSNMHGRKARNFYLEEMNKVASQLYTPLVHF